MSTKKTINTIKNFRKITKNNNVFALDKSKVTEFILHNTKAKRKI